MKYLLTILIFISAVTCQAQQEKVFLVKAKDQKVQLYPDLDTLMTGTMTAFNVLGMDIKKVAAVFNCGTTEISDKSVWLHIDAGLPAGKKCLLQIFSKEQTMKLVYEKSYIITPFAANTPIVRKKGSPAIISMRWNNIPLKGKDTLTKSQLLIIGGKAHLVADDDIGGFHFVSSFKLQIVSPTINKKFTGTAPALKGELLQTLNDLIGNYKIILSEVAFTDGIKMNGPYIIWVKN